MLEFFKNIFKKLKYSINQENYIKRYADLINVFRRVSPLNYSDVETIHTILKDLVKDKEELERQMKILKKAYNSKKKTIVKNVEIPTVNRDRDVTYCVSGSIVYGDVNSEEEFSYFSKDNILALNSLPLKPKICDFDCLKNECKFCLERRLRNEIARKIEFEQQTTKKRKVSSKVVKDLNEELGLPGIFARYVADEKFKEEDLDEEEKAEFLNWKAEQKNKTELARKSLKLDRQSVDSLRTPKNMPVASNIPFNTNIYENPRELSSKNGISNQQAFNIVNGEDNVSMFTKPSISSFDNQFTNIQSVNNEILGLKDDIKENPFPSVIKPVADPSSFQNTTSQVLSPNSTSVQNPFSVASNLPLSGENVQLTKNEKVTILESEIVDKPSSFVNKNSETTNFINSQTSNIFNRKTNSQLNNPFESLNSTGINRSKFEVTESSATTHPKNEVKNPFIQLDSTISNKPKAELVNPFESSESKNNPTPFQFLDTKKSQFSFNPVEKTSSVADNQVINNESANMTFQQKTEIFQPKASSIEPFKNDSSLFTSVKEDTLPKFNFPSVQNPFGSINLPSEQKQDILNTPQPNSSLFTGGKSSINTFTSKPSDSPSVFPNLSIDQPSNSNLSESTIKQPAVSNSFGSWSSSLQFNKDTSDTAVVNTSQGTNILTSNVDHLNSISNNSLPSSSLNPTPLNSIQNNASPFTNTFTLNNLSSNTFSQQQNTVNPFSNSVQTTSNIFPSQSNPFTSKFTNPFQPPDLQSGTLNPFSSNFSNVNIFQNQSSTSAEDQGSIFNNEESNELVRKRKAYRKKY